MKRLALGILLASIAGAACAADLPPYAKAPAMVSPAPIWSGAYFGVNGVYAAETGSDHF
jgi:hypothetical protein